MAILRPVGERAALLAAVEGVRKARLVGVRYTEGDRGGDRGEAPPYCSARGAVELQADVELRFDNKKRLVVQWAMEGFDYGLSVKAEADDAKEAPAGTWYGPWEGLVGKELAGIRSAWLRPAGGSIAAMWSMTLEFHPQAAVTIALGRIEADDTVGFSPDGLVVFFDPAGAAAYELPDSTGNAYGERGGQGGTG